MDNPLIPAVKYATLITEGDGVQTAWEFNFAGGYISPEHVKAFTEDTVSGELVIRPLTLIGPNTAQITPAVADGLRLIIYRDTPKTEPLVDYSTGSILNESSLDKSNRQAVFIAAELADRVIADYDFSNALLYAVTTATNASQVANAIDGKAQTALDNSVVARADAATARADAVTSLTAVSGLRTELNSTVGAGIVRTTRGRTVQAVLNEQHSILDFQVLGEATAEAMINRSIAAHNVAVIPAGVWPINLGVGVIVRTGTKLLGDGKNKTILSAVQGTGGTLAQLAAYQRGSIVRRQFSLGVPNAYVNDVYIADVCGLMNHSETSITPSDTQIAFDMRNISGSTLERVHFGNIAPVGGAAPVKTGNKSYLIQGYGVAIGTVDGGNIAYAGGERNRIINCSGYGAYKLIIQDDTSLSPNSASYATTVRDCDLQSAHWIIGQMGQYGAGNVHVGNTLQDIVKRNGDSGPSYAQYYDGYNNIVTPTYIECGSNCDYQLYLDTDSNNNRVNMTMAGFTSGAGAIVDNGNAGSKNRISHFGPDGTGEIVEMYNKARVSCWVKFHWDGTNVIIDGQAGVASVTRTGVGDYLVTWQFPFPSSSYGMPPPNMDTGASGLAGVSCILSASASNVRYVLYTQNAGVTTKVDPRSVWVTAHQ